jgi:hypothetical protein
MFQIVTSLLLALLPDWELNQTSSAVMKKQHFLS